MGRRKKSTELSKEDRIGALVNTLSKRFPGKVLSGRDYSAPWALRRLPSGILNLDIATNGGLPAGGMTMITGKPNEGKNWLLCQYIAQQQRIYGDECAFAIIGTEMPFDKMQARKANVSIALSDEEIEMEDQVIRQTSCGTDSLDDETREGLKSQIGHFTIVPPSTAEESFELAVELVKSREFNIVAIDSFGSVLPEEDKDKSMGDNSKVGGASGLNTRLMRKLNEAMSPDEDGKPNLTCVIGINQIRDNIGARAFQKQISESGGWALKHGRFVTIELTRIAHITKEVRGKKMKVGKTIKWEITKQKAGGHDGHVGTYNFYFAPTLHHNREEVLVEELLDLGLIEKKGAWFTIEDTNLQGINAVAEYIRTKKLLDDLEQKVLQAHGVGYRF